MTVKLLTEQHLEFLNLVEATHARLSLHLTKCQIVENLIPRLCRENLCVNSYLKKMVDPLPRCSNQIDLLKHGCRVSVSL